MGLVSTSNTNILTILQDSTTSPINYSFPELYYYWNEGLRFISIELAKINNKLANKTSSPVFAVNTFSVDLSTLTPAVTDLLSLVNDDKARAKVFNVTNNYSRMHKAYEDAIDRWENETNTNNGTPDHFYLRGNILYIHPRPNVQTTVKFYYHPLQTITDGTSTIPWNGLFDNALERFVLANCRQRSEQFNYTQIDVSLFNALKDQVFDILYMREEVQWNLADGQGSSNDFYFNWDV